MAITRAQQYRQMLEDGGMLVSPSTTGKRPGYREKKAQEGRRGVTSSPTKSAFTGNEDRQQYSATQTQTGKVKGGGPKQYESDGSSRFLDSKVDTDRARRAQAEFLLDTSRGLSELRKRGVTQIPPGFPGSGVLNLLTPFRNFTLRKNIDYFRGLEKIKTLKDALGRNLYPETEQGYRDYMRDRLAGKIDAAGNLKAGFMRGPDGTIMSTGNDGRDDAIIPVMAEAMKKEDTKDDLSNIFARFGINPRIAGSIFEDEDEDNIEFAAEGGRIGYNDGGMLVQPGFGGTRQGYRSEKAQESKQKSAQEYKASTTQQQRDDDRRDFQEQRKQAVQRLEEAKPTSSRRKGIENAVRTASELNYLRNLYKLDPVGLGLSFVGNKISDFLFPPAGAAELSEDELNILRATGQLENQKQKILDATGIGSGAEVGPVPDLTDPKVAGGIAEAGGLTTGLKKVGGKEIFGTTIGGEQIRVPTDLSQQAIEEIQRDKRQLGLTRDQVIDKALDFDYPTSITEEGAGTIYDMVQADQLPRTLAAEGGIMDLGRQELFLGGIVKGLKKAAKGVSRTLKKVAKSPIGKAAILGAIGFGIPGTSFGGIFGKGALSRFIGQKAMTQAPFGPGTGILGFIQNNPMLAIAGTSALAGALTPKEKDDQDEFLRQYYNMRLDPSQSVRGMGSQFDFYNTQFVADGGRIGYQEGSKEPVAKKTMPLLDMDGQEMDLRAEGGFVPIGRMEKADDVPARLSKNEFVFTADAVRNAGDGDVDKGAEVMYNMMKNLERGGNVSDESQGLEGAREMFQTSKRLEEVL